MGNMEKIKGIKKACSRSKKIEARGLFSRTYFDVNKKEVWCSEFVSSNSWIDYTLEKDGITEICCGKTRMSLIRERALNVLKKIEKQGKKLTFIE
jgi:hypothetical protein